MYSSACLLNFMVVFLIPLKCLGGPVKPHHGTCTADVPKITHAINKFGFALTKKVEGFENMFITPFSTSFGLGLFYLAAKGETKKEMENVLGFKDNNISGTEVFEGYRQLLDNLTDPSHGQHIFSMRNGFFIESGFGIRQSYLDDANTYFHTSAATLDFVNQPLEAMNAINEWVRVSSHGKVDHFLLRPLPSFVKMVSLYTTYFNGTWKIPFSLDNTRHGYFHAGNSDGTLSRPMMVMTSARLRYLKDDESGYKYLEMPFKGDELSMILALPLLEEHPDSSMSNDLLCRIKSSMVYTELENVVIPKFRFAYKKSLKSTLKSMGMIRSFSPYTADFTGIGRGVYMIDVPLRSVIEIAEHGSDALFLPGYTRVPTRDSVSGTPLNITDVPGVHEFIATRPFLFYIVHSETGLVLFSGKVVTP